MYGGGGVNFTDFTAPGSQPPAEDEFRQLKRLQEEELKAAEE